jgi:hypothetical protein
LAEAGVGLGPIGGRSDDASGIDCAEGRNSIYFSLFEADSAESVAGDCGNSINGKEIVDA